MQKLTTIIIIFISILLVNSCCGNIQCDCIGQIISFSYRDMNQNCNDNAATLISFASYNSLTHEVIRENAIYYTENCQFNLEYYYGIYWVASSDVFGISDTLRLIDIDFIEKTGKDCCNCPTPVNGLSMDINGNIYTGNNFTVNY